MPDYTAEQILSARRRIGAQNPAATTQAQRITAEQIRAAQARPGAGAISATLGGPRAMSDAAVADANVQEAAAPPPAPPVSREGALNLLEVGGSLAGASAAGMLARRGASLMKVGSSVVRGGLNYLTRMAGAAAGGIGGSELGAPEGETEQEQFRRRVQAGTSALAGEAISFPIEYGLGKVIGAGKKRFLGAPKERIAEGAEAAQKILEKSGESLSVGEVRTGGIIRTIENMVRSSFTGGYLARGSARASAAAGRILDNMVPAIARNLTTDETGALLTRVIEDSAEVQRGLVRGAYSAIDAKIAAHGADGAVVNMEAFYREQAPWILKKIKMGDENALKMWGLLKGATGVDVVDGKLRIPLESMRVTLAQADELRSAFLAIGRRGTDLIPGTASKANEAAALLDREMSMAGIRIGALGEEIISDFHAARALSKLGKDRFNRGIIPELLAKTSPEQLSRALFAADNPSAVRAVVDVLFEPKYLQAVGNPQEVLATLQASYIAQLKRSAGEVGAGEVSGNLLGKAVDEANGTFRELFRSAKDRETIRAAARAMELSQAKSAGSRSGSIIMQFEQAGAAGQLVALGVVGAVSSRDGFTTNDLWAPGVILLAPAFASVVLRNRPFVNFMLHRANTSLSRSGRTTGHVMGQVIGHLRAMQIPFSYRDAAGNVTDYEPDTPQAQTPKRNPLKPASRF